MIHDLEEIVRLIESAGTSEATRDEYLSKLNVFGFKETEIEACAVTLWTNYFRANLKELLQEKPAIESHLLQAEQIRNCFEVAFQEYTNRKKDLGIDDIRKFWFPV